MRIDTNKQITNGNKFPFPAKPDPAPPENSQPIYWRLGRSFAPFAYSQKIRYSNPVAIALLFLVLLFTPHQALAVTYRHCEGLQAGQCSQQVCGPFMCGIADTCAKIGRCGLPDLMQVVYNVGNFVLMISASLVLLMYVVGGVMYLTARGDKNGVTKGTNYIKYSTYGLLIVFSAYLFVFTIKKILIEGSV